MKVDVSRAFRNVPIDPRDAIKCGTRHRGNFYVDKNLVFGAVNGTLIFERISDAIVSIMRAEGAIVWNYIDDLFWPPLLRQPPISLKGYVKLFHLIDDLYG